MNDYYCNNCKTVIGRCYYDENKCCNISDRCYYIKSKKINSIYFMNCGICNKFVGLSCMHVCSDCFGKDQIFNKKKLFNWLIEYEKRMKKYIKFDFICKNCNKKNFRNQYWFFEELTFYK